MAVVGTTVAAGKPIAVTDSSINLTSGTGVADGYLIRVDHEVMRVTSGYVAAATAVPVLRGWDGTAAGAHPASAKAIIINPAEGGGASAPGGPAVAYPAQRATMISSYSAAGAIALPAVGNDARVFLNGTSALAMTLANPGKEQDGDVLEIIGNGKAAHTVTYTAGAGDGGSGLDVFTFDTNAQLAMRWIASNGLWNLAPSPISGTLTGVDVAVA